VEGNSSGQFCSNIHILNTSSKETFVNVRIAWNPANYRPQASSNASPQS